MLPPQRYRDSDTTDAVNDIEPSILIEPDETSVEQAPAPDGAEAGSDHAAVDPNAQNEVNVSQTAAPVAEEEVDACSLAKWGEMEGTTIKESVVKAYEEVVKWKRNLFFLPTGKVGENFIAELTRVITLFNEGGAFEPVAMMMATIMFPLLLQKPSPSSKTSDHVKYLERRLVMWKEGKLKNLLNEGKAIQSRMTKGKRKAENGEQRFVHLMEDGKISAALRCIGSLQCGVHPITEEVLNTLKEKHPPAQDAQQGSLLQGPLLEQFVEPVVFERLDADSIRRAAKRINGAAGPSGADSDLWMKLLCSKQHKNKPTELCEAVADLAKKLNRNVVSPSHLRAFVAGRLIPLDKKNQVCDRLALGTFLEE